MTERTCTQEGCERKHQARGLCSPHYKRWQVEQPSYLRTQYPATCAVCGVGFMATKPNVRYCTTGVGSCLAADRRAPVPMHVKRKRARAQTKLAKAALGTQGGRWVAGPCQECGEPYISKWHPLWPGRYCSGPCQRRVERRRSKLRRRTRLLGLEYESINSRLLFERDSYRCGLCRRKTKRNAKVPDPRAPTIDHIIPLSQGGPHIWTNVQCACFGCNWHKAAGAANDQLLLVG